MKDITNPLYTAILRQKAEEILKSRNVKYDSNKIDAETFRLIHELDVHQIELEMQNEELVMAKKTAEIDSVKYANLYDFAPSGYLTLSKEGEIVELNFSSANLLGKERSLLIKNRFGFFVSNDTRNIFNEFIDTLLNSKNKETCELTLNVNPDAPTYVYLTGIASYDKQQCFITMVDITRRKRAEEEIKASEEKYRSLFENSKDSIIIASIGDERGVIEGSFINVNKAATELYGYPKEEMLVMNFNDVDKVSKKIRRDRDKEFIAAGKLSFETVVKTKKGNKRNIETEFFLIEYEGKPAIMNISRDITERKQNELNTRKVLEKLATILEAIPDLLFEVGQDGKIYHCQSPDKKLLTCTPEKFMGKLLQDVFPPDAATICLQAIEEARDTGRSTGKQYTLELAHRKSWFEISVSPIKESNGTDKRFIFIARDITEQKLTELALQESDKRLTAIFNLASSGIIETSSEGKILLFNDRSTEMFGYTREEMSQLSSSDLIHPDEIKKNSDITALINKGEQKLLQYERLFLRKDKSSFWGEVSLTIIKNPDTNSFYAIAVVMDITERKRTQEKIQQLSLAVEQSPVTIIITNTNGEIEYANPKFTEITGYTLEEITEKKMHILNLSTALPNKYKTLWKIITKGKEWHGEFHNKKKNGELYWESASISPIVDTQGKTTHYIAIKEDITFEKNLKEELLKAKERAEESDRLKLAFLANMSHEIRTPMNGILGFTTLLKEPKLSGEEQQEYINIIEKSGKRMLNIINDIINISRIESGLVEISLTKTNINEQIKDLNTFFQKEALKKGLQLIVTKQLPPIDSTLLTDKEKVYAILTNLVKNALKFTDSGSIEFGCIKKDTNLEFFVKDTGSGISEAQQGIIFERFRQANESLTRTHEGSGLGLAISKAYVEMLGGKIWVESEEGKGSTFYFTIPFYDDYKLDKKLTAKKEDPKLKIDTKVKDLKVLIVEDDAISKLLITIALKPYSKEILKVSTGIEAIETCRTNPDINLIMMDINMPEMGGYEATKKIREFNKDIIIIAQTANGMQGDRDQAIAAGCTDYIAKPVNINSLALLIQKYFGK
jgi:hypothetical protein